MIINFLFKALAAIMCLIGSFSGLRDAGELVARQYAINGSGTTEIGNGRVSIHDPSVIKDGDSYYIFGSHLCAAKSSDLLNWSDISCGVSDTNQLLVKPESTIRDTLSEPLEWTDAYQSLYAYDENVWQTNIWAPEVIYNKTMGKYCYYSCSSVWGTTASVIWLATSDDIEGTYKYQSTVVYSGFNNQTLDGKYIRSNSMHFSFTNIGRLLDKGTLKIKDVQNAPWFRADGTYNSEIYPNCIDPNVFYDKNGNLWMSYGSFFGGIYIMPLVEKTGLPDYKYMKKTEGYDMYFGKKIIATAFANDLSGEGAYIRYDPQTDYYYLFISYGGLNALGGYNMREYRSKSPDGPFIDAKGNPATDNANTGLKLMGSYKLSSLDTAYLAAGHNSVLCDEDGKLLNVYHQRFNNGFENYETRVHQLVRNKNGWAVMLPFEYRGEAVSNCGYDLSAVSGEYEFVAHGNITNKADTWENAENIITPTQNITLNPDGTISRLKVYESVKENTAVSSADAVGTWSIEEGTPYITLTINDVKYEGVLCIQKDESKDNKNVLVFSAAGENNECIWGVHK